MNWKILTSFIISGVFSTAIAQENTCKCFNKEEYKKFVASEQYQNVQEGSDAIFTLLLNRKMKEDIIVSYSVQSGSATLNKDFYSTSSGSITIPKGALKGYIKIPTANDNETEANETFTLKLTKGVMADSGKELKNQNLVRTRTIIDANTSDNSTINFYEEEGSIKSSPTFEEIEIFNHLGNSVDNTNLTPGTYFVNAIINGNTIKRQLLIN